MEMKKNNALFNASRHLTYGKEKKSKARDLPPGLDTTLT